MQQLIVQQEEEEIKEPFVVVDTQSRMHEIYDFDQQYLPVYEATRNNQDYDETFAALFAVGGVLVVLGVTSYLKWTLSKRKGEQIQANRGMDEIFFDTRGFI